MASRLLTPLARILALLIALTLALQLGACSSAPESHASGSSTPPPVPGSTAYLDMIYRPGSTVGVGG